MLRRTISAPEFYEMSDDQLISFIVKRPKEERYAGFLQLPKEKRKICLVTRDGRLLLLHLNLKKH